MVAAVKSYRFDCFTLDLERLCLHGPAGQIDLRRKSFDVLRCLIEHSGRVVTKDELIKAVWPDVTVGDDSLTQCVSEVRRAIGDRDQQVIKTIPRRGYLIEPPATLDRLAMGSAARAINMEVATECLQPRPPPSDRPSIAVLPFLNLSGDPEQEYFADGIVEDIITDLSKFGELFVIARNSSFQYKARSSDIRQVGHELGVRYVLEGSVRRIGHRVRIAAQLIEAETGGHLWAQKYDHDYVEILALQERVTESVVAAIAPEILLYEGRRAARRSLTNLDALDCCMRGSWHFYRATPSDDQQALNWLRRSIELDPTLARAHMMLGRFLAVRCWLGCSDDIERDLQAGQAAAKRAIELDDGDAAGYYVLSIVSLMNRKHERALATARRAIELNANFALGHFALGEVLVFGGRFAEAIEPLQRCLRLTPRDPFASYYVSLIALAHYHLEDYPAALAFSERALQRRRTHVVLRTLAATLGQLGRIEEARAVRVEMELMKPADPRRYWELTNPYASAGHEAHLLEGLQKVGMAASDEQIAADRDVPQKRLLA